MKISERNGIIYLKECDVTYDWCDSKITTKGIENYFPLNKVTRMYFAYEILPLINNGSATIDPSLLHMISSFRQNQELEERIDMSKSPPGITLKPHQEKALSLMATHNKYGFFYGTGTGKTLIAITWLMNAEPKTCLVVTPQKVIGQYQKELNKYIPGNTYEVTNFEQLHKFIDKTYEAVIVDESHKVKNYSSNMNENLRTISAKANYVYIFTGSPMDKSRHEILPQLAILDSRVMPVKTKIYERYFRLDDYFCPKHEIRDRSGELTRIINAYTYGVKTEDVIDDLPNEINNTIRCDHPKKYYDLLLDNRVVRKDEEWFCMADTKAQLRLSLKEICSGILSLQNSLEERKWIKFESTKTMPLMSLLRSLDMAIIYYEFTESIDDITGVIKSIGKTCVVVNGSTNKKKTTELIEQFKTKQVDYLVIQSKSGNAGLDLTVTNNIIFYSLPDSYIVFHQAKSRIRRIGQTRECNYYYLLCDDTMEINVYETLKKKKSFNDKVFAQYIKE